MTAPSPLNPHHATAMAAGPAEERSVGLVLADTTRTRRVPGGRVILTVEDRAETSTAPAAGQTPGHFAGGLGHTAAMPGGRLLSPEPVPPVLPATPGSTPLRGYWAAPWAPPEVVQRLQDHDLMILERISGATGHGVRRQAVDGMFTAVDLLAGPSGGFDVSGLVYQLDPATLRRRFKTDAIALPKVTAEDGTEMVHRVLVIDDFAEQGLIIALSTGTGTKLDQNLRGPAVDWFARQVRAYQPGLVFARNWKRWSRNGWAYASLASAFKDLAARQGGPAFGGSWKGIRPLDKKFERELFAEGADGEQEAEEFRVLTSGGSKRKTATQMVGGRMQHGASHAPPPGTAAARVWPGAFAAADHAAGRLLPPEERGTGSLRYLYIDEPASRPDPTLVIESTAPQGHGDGRDPVDQAALVQWFLGHYGSIDPDGTVWEKHACAAYLVEHGFCTEGLRRARHEPTPSYRHGGDKDQAQYRARNICRAVLDHLEEYRTATFTVALVGDTGARATVTGLHPSGKPWMSQRDYDRIRDFQAGRTGTPPRGTCLLSGLAVTLNGTHARLEASTKPPLRYYFATADGKARLGTRDEPLPPLRHDTAVNAIADAVARADVLPRMAPVVQAGTADLRRDRTRLREHLTQLRTQNAKTKAVLDTEVVTDDLLESINTDFNTCAAAIKKAERELASVETELARTQDPHLPGIADVNLTRFVRALADPRSREGRALVHDNLELDIRTYDLQEPGRPICTGLRLRGALVVHDETGSYRAPIVADQVAEPRRRVDGRLEAAVEALRDGTPMADALGADSRRWLTLVRDALGCGRDQFRLANVDDPRLLRLGMAVLHPRPATPGPDPDHPRLAGPPLPPSGLRVAARRLGEPIELLRRILAVHTQPAQRRRWLYDRSPVAGAAYQQAAGTGSVRTAGLPSPDTAPQVLRAGPYGAEWTVTRGTAKLARCAGCDGTDRVPLRLREASGSVCRACRTDRAGVGWPDTYDRYAQPADEVDPS